MPLMTEVAEAAKAVGALIVFHNDVGPNNLNAEAGGAGVVVVGEAPVVLVEGTVVVVVPTVVVVGAERVQANR